MTQKELFERGKFIATEIERAYVHADDDWKKAYYHNAAEYLAKNKIFEGGKLCAFCRERAGSSRIRAEPPRCAVERRDGADDDEPYRHPPTSQSHDDTARGRKPCHNTDSMQHCTSAAQSQPPIERDETMFCCGSTDEQAPSSAPPQSPAAGKSDATLVTIQYCGS